MNDNPSSLKVSVIIPVYNVAPLLPRCIDSILQQTLKETEIICIDDCGPDNSGAILDRYAAVNPSIRVIHKSSNEGPMKAREDGYKMAKGEYIFFCDGDDYLPLDSLEKLYNAADKSGADIVVGNAESVTADNRRSLRNRTSALDSKWQTYLKSILNWGTPALWGSLYKRDLFLDVEYTAEKKMPFSEDRLLLTEMLILKKPVIHPLEAITYYYWANQNSTTRKKLTDEAVTLQFKALFRSYDFVNGHTKGFEADNDNQMARYLSLYIERGVKANTLRNINSTTQRLLGFNTMRRTMGMRMAVHTFLGMNLPGYAYLMFRIRKRIRKMQGKE